MKTRKTLIGLMAAVFVVLALATPVMARVRSAVLKRGKKHTLALRPKETVVLYFYPKGKRDASGTISLTQVWEYQCCPHLKEKPPLICFKFYPEKAIFSTWGANKGVLDKFGWGVSIDFRDPTWPECIVEENPKLAISKYKLVITCKRGPILSPAKKRDWERRYGPEITKPRVSIVVSTNDKEKPLTKYEKEEREERFRGRTCFARIKMGLKNNTNWRIPADWYREGTDYTKAVKVEQVKKYLETEKARLEKEKKNREDKLKKMESWLENQKSKKLPETIEAARRAFIPPLEDELKDVEKQLAEMEKILAMIKRDRPEDLGETTEAMKTSKRSRDRVVLSEAN